MVNFCPCIGDAIEEGGFSAPADPNDSAFQCHRSRFDVKVTEKKIRRKCPYQSVYFFLMDATSCDTVTSHQAGAEGLKRLFNASAYDSALNKSFACIHLNSSESSDNMGKIFVREIGISGRTKVRTESGPETDH